ncbi:MAG: DNRLRE domain-containing protein [Promethearchaeota archaeon]
MIKRQCLLSSAFLMMFSIIAVADCFVQPIHATHETTAKVWASKDTFISSGEPTINYGGQDDLKVGFFSLFYRDEYQAYIYLDLSSKPSTLISAEFYFYIWGVSQTMRFTLAISDEFWSEYYVDWEHKLSLTRILKSFLIAGDGFYKISITNSVMNRTGITLIFFIDELDFVNDYVYIDSREDMFKDYRPALIFTYLEEEPISTEAILWIAFALVWVVLGVLYFVFKPDNKNKRALNTKPNKDTLDK